MIFQQITRTFHALKKETNGNYQLYDVSLSELWDNLYHSAYIDMSKMHSYDNFEKLQRLLKKAILALGKQPSVSYKYIVVDKNWEEIFRNTPSNQFTICTFKQEDFFIFSYDKAKSTTLTLTTPYTKEYFLKHLVSETLFDAGHYSWSDESLQMSIPAIDDYPELAVKDNLAGITNQIFYTKNTIISPFTAKDFQQLKTGKISKTGFPSYISELPAYEKLLDFVVEHQIEPNRYSRKEIHNAYQKLIRDYLEVIK